MLNSARMRSSVATCRVLAIAVVVVAALGGAVGCPSETDAGGDEKRVLGADGRERWIVTFEGAAPDLAEYRSLRQSSPSDADAYAERMRKKLAHDHADFDSGLQAVSGRIVEQWWMSNAVTVEVEASAVPTLRGLPGVKAISPDVALGD